MGFIQAYECLIKSREYREWYPANKKSYLAHAFTMKQNKELDNWQIGFYDPKNDELSVFELTQPIFPHPPQKAFKLPGHPIKEVMLDDIKTDLESALEIAATHQETNFANLLPTKYVIILQSIDEGQVWNLTLIGRGFDVLNIKIATNDGSIVESNLKRIFDFKGNTAA